MPEAYSDTFWNCFLIVSLVVLFWVALHEDAKEDTRDPDPSLDVTKTRNLGCYTGGPARGRR